MINEEKQKALEAALGHIEKQYGKGICNEAWGIPGSNMGSRSGSDRLSWTGYCAWSRWSAEGTYRGDLRTGIQW